MREDLKKQEAVALALACIKRINDYPVSFNTIKTLQQLIDRFRNSIATVRQLINSDQPLIESQSMYGLSPGNFHPLIIQALRNKTQQIISGALAQREFLRQAARMIYQFIQEIQAFPIFFEPSIDEGNIDGQCLLLKNRLQELSSQQSERFAVFSNQLGITIGNISGIREALTQKIQQIDQIAKLEKDKIARSQQALEILNQNSFYDYLSKIEKQTEITKIMNDINDQYAEYASIATSLHLGLTTITNQFVYSSDPITPSLLEFKAQCLHLIEEHHSHLKGLPEWDALLNTMKLLVLKVNIILKPQDAQQTSYQFFTAEALPQPSNSAGPAQLSPARM